MNILFILEQIQGAVGDTLAENGVRVVAAIT